MDIKLNILADNIVTKSGFIAEHGLSVLIETPEGDFLLDTGQGMVFEHNAKLLGLNLDRIKDVILSHGHYDHAGGIKNLAMTRKINLFAHNMAKRKRFKLIERGKYKSIGIDWLDDQTVEKNINWVLSDKPHYLSDNILLSGQIPRQIDFEKPPAHFYFLDDNNKYIKDTVPDDQSVFINTPKGLIIITGCAHSGLINSIMYAKKLFKTDKILAVVGGTHLLNATDEKIDKTISAIIDLKVEELYAGHCTGLRSMHIFYNRLKNRFHSTEVGQQIIWQNI